MNQVNVVLLLTIITSSLAAPNTKSIGGRIVGGEDAKEGQFPYMVSIRTGFSLIHICGGSIIAPNVVLTAARCVAKKTSDTVEIQVGSVNLDRGQFYLVKEIIVHEEFDSQLNDVALLILDDNITLSDNVQIVNLREVDRDEKEECVLSGWGDTPTEVPDNLKFINLTTITREECSNHWDDIIPVYDNQTCTLTKRGEGACYGDTGGPLVDSEGNQIGIVSWGRPCAHGLPDVYTRVASYIDWIKENGNLD